MTTTYLGGDGRGRLLLLMLMLLLRMLLLLVLLLLVLLLLLRRLRRRLLFAARISGRRLRLGYGVEHVVEPVALVVVQRHGPAVALGHAALGQQRGRDRVAPGPRLHGRGHGLAVGRRELQRGAEPLPVGPPLQQARGRGARGRRARVPGQQLPLAHALVAVVAVVRDVPAIRTEGNGDWASETEGVADGSGDKGGCFG